MQCNICIGHFSQTSLHSELQKRKINQVYITGLATDFCDYYTAMDAVSLGYITTLVEDGRVTTLVTCVYFCSCDYMVLLNIGVRGVTPEGVAIAKANVISLTINVLVYQWFTRDGWMICVQ
jgi:hypothetical protein